MARCSADAILLLAAVVGLVASVVVVVKPERRAA